MRPVHSDGALVDAGEDLRTVARVAYRLLDEEPDLSRKP